MLNMGTTFRIAVEIENPARPGDRRELPATLVATGAELSWVPAEILESLGVERYAVRRFHQVDGTVLDRWTGPAFVHAVGKRTADDVVFGEPERSRPTRRSNAGRSPTSASISWSKRLVDAGPAPAAAAMVLFVALNYIGMAKPAGSKRMSTNSDGTSTRAKDRPNAPMAHVPFVDGSSSAFEPTAT